MRLSHCRPGTLALLAPALLLTLSACDNDPEVQDDAASEVSRMTVAGLIAATADLSTVEAVLDDTGMAPLFDAAPPYTVFAPTNAAMESLGEDFAGEGARPALIAVLRSHIVPGFMTLEDISAAVETQGGTVEMQTMAGSTLSFRMEGEQLVVSPTGGDASATISEQMLGANGVVVPVDTVLKDLETGR